MEKPLSPAAFVFAAIVLTLSLLSLSIVTPQNDYYRWQELTSGTTRKADWIYERLHFDPAPIDVALIGTSRTGGGLSGPDIEAAYCKATGRTIRVANLSLPETGRNLQYVIAKEAMRTKAPALTVVELNETEPFKQHRGFVILADTADVLSAPIIANINFFPDLVRLPGRQAILFFRTLAGRGAVRDKFEPSAYPGRDVDRTREMWSLDGDFVSRFVAMQRDELDSLYAGRANKLTTILEHSKKLLQIEYRVPRIYLKKIRALADENSLSVAYSFIPAWREPVLPEKTKSALGVDGPIIDLGGSIAEDPGMWLNPTHVNAWGAEKITARFADQLSKYYPTLGEAGC